MKAFTAANIAALLAPTVLLSQITGVVSFAEAALEEFKAWPTCGWYCQNQFNKGPLSKPYNVSNIRSVCGTVPKDQYKGALWDDCLGIQCENKALVQMKNWNSLWWSVCVSADSDKNSKKKRDFTPEETYIKEQMAKQPTPLGGKDWTESHYKGPLRGYQGEGCDFAPTACEGKAVNGGGSSSSDSSSSGSSTAASIPIGLLAAGAVMLL